MKKAEMSVQISFAHDLQFDTDWSFVSAERHIPVRRPTARRVDFIIVESGLARWKADWRNV